MLIISVLLNLCDDAASVFFNSVASVSIFLSTECNYKMVKTYSYYNLHAIYFILFCLRLNNLKL